VSRVARELQVELSKLDDIGLTYIVGNQPEEIRVEPDPERLSLYGVTLQQLQGKIQAPTAPSRQARCAKAGQQVSVMGGQTLQSPSEIANILLTARDGRPVYVRDVANVILASDSREVRAADVRLENGKIVSVPAVSVALAKRPGTNAVAIAERITERLHEIEGHAGARRTHRADHPELWRDGEREGERTPVPSGLATVSIVLLVAFSIGWREALVVAVVIPTTILLTLFAARVMGYTLNRVSLFALIFSIGILVDDAIVVIENIARHWAMKDGRSRVDAAVDAVAEVGNPTIVATLTVVAALLPMLFVSGLMGPYMSPIPANASAAMIFSFFVAVMVTPWLMLKFGGGHGGDGGTAAITAHADGGFLGRMYLGVARPILKTKARSWIFLVLVGARDPGLARALLHEGRDGEAPALRQQVGAAGGGRPSRGLIRRGDEPRADRSRGRGARHPRGAFGPDLCRGGRALQLQRPRAPLLHAQLAGTGRCADHARGEVRA
jgi:multidrug efflux pump subunit AcrB